MGQKFKCKNYILKIIYQCFSKCFHTPFHLLYFCGINKKASTGSVVTFSGSQVLSQALTGEKTKGNPNQEEKIP
jgi:hypothetical protein